MAVRLRRKNGPAPLRNRIRRIFRELHRERAVDIGATWILWTFPPVRLRTPTREIRALGLGLLVKAGLLHALDSAAVLVDPIPSMEPLVVAEASK